MELRSEHLLDGTHLFDERKFSASQHTYLIASRHDTITYLGLSNEPQTQPNTPSGWDKAPTGVAEDTSDELGTEPTVQEVGDALDEVGLVVADEGTEESLDQEIPLIEVALI